MNEPGRAVRKADSRSLVDAFQRAFTWMMEAYEDGDKKTFMNMLMAMIATHKEGRESLETVIKNDDEMDYEKSLLDRVQMLISESGNGKPKPGAMITIKGKDYKIKE